MNSVLLERKLYFLAGPGLWLSLYSTVVTPQLALAPRLNSFANNVAIQIHKNMERTLLDSFTLCLYRYISFLSFSVSKPEKITPI